MGRSNRKQDQLLTNHETRICECEEMLLEHHGEGSEEGGESGVTLSDVFELVYPIGSIYIATISTNPATLFGFGTWTAFGAGKVLVGLDSGDTDFDTPEETGGSKTHSHTQGTLAVANHSDHTHDTITNVSVDSHVSHTHDLTTNVSVDSHASHTHTYSQILNHTHAVDITDGGHNHTQDAHNHTQNSHNHTQDAHSHVENNNSATTGGLTGWGARDTSTNTSAATDYSTATTVATNQATTATNIETTATNQANTTGITASSQNPAGGVATGTTAGPSATLTHTTNNGTATSTNESASLTHTTNNPAVTSGNPSATLTHTLSGSTASGSNVPPYVVVHFWKRTA